MPADSEMQSRQRMVSFRFRGFMVQCLNEFPRFRDKSNSFYRRQLFVPFDKCYKGVERRYIKDGYLGRQEVLEYDLCRVLHMDYYELSEPETCKRVLSEYMEFNDPVKQFFAEMEGQFVWDLLPFGFLYELYKSWFRRNCPSGRPQGKHTFIAEIVREANSSSVWCCKDRSLNVRSDGRMEGPEPLIMEYGLEDWKNPTYIGSDRNRISRPALKDFYRGAALQKRMARAQAIVMAMPQQDDERFPARLVCCGTSDLPCQDTTF